MVIKRPVELKEIIVVTDGRSNIGGNPIDAARIAHREGIIVNTIGIVGEEGEESPFIELDGIARAGGGICDIVPLYKLGYSMQMVTRKSIQMSIERAVSSQLKEIVGYSLQEMEPQSRSKIIEYIKKVGEEVSLKCAILLDCSGSMSNKLDAAVDSIQELIISFKSRKGKSSLAVLAFPGDRGEECKVISGFTTDYSRAMDSLRYLKAKGGTPTYGGIIKAISLFGGEECPYPVKANIY